MKRRIILYVALLIMSLGVQDVRAQAVAHSGDVSISGTVHVAPPTGERETDRASILAALEVVQLGETVQFAPGTYLMGGEIIRVTVPRITLQGHPEGTTLRGCNPDEFPMEDPFEFGNNCNGIELAGGWQTVRDLTFEHAFWALHVGCCWDGFPNMRSGEGGHLIEGNTFRSSSNAVRVHGFWSEPTVIQNNKLLNNWHSVAIYGNTVHLLDNDISAPEPEDVQWFGFPWEGIHISRPVNLKTAEGGSRSCQNNVVAGNRIDGVLEGILMTADEPEIICRNNVIRDNTIVVRRARPPAVLGFIQVNDESDSTVVGVPLALRGAIEDNLIEGNVIIGAEGLGIEIRHASRNRIVNNTVTRVVRREPFPGNPDAWREANGSAIWLSPGSDENEIIGNTFEDVASHAIVLEGDRNVVEKRSSSDTVRDLGSGNRVSRSNSVQTRIIEVDGHAVHVYTSGWEHLERGQPVVVFEGGGFSTLDAWGDLPARLAQEAAVVAYDRAGSGRSEWDGQRPTLEHVTSRLRRILEVLGAPPPFIHVGHSFGGPLGFAFAREYHDEMAGLVLIDPTPPAADWFGAFDDIGVGKAGYDEFDEMFRRAFEGAPESMLIELDVLSGYFSDPDASPWSPPDLSVPIAVLLAGAGYEVPPELPSTFDLDQQHQALLLRQIANYAEWTRTVPDATIIVANNSRHCIHCWDPELVIGAIRRVLYSDVRVQLRQAMATDGVSSIAPTYHALRSRYPDSHFDESRLESLGRELLGFGQLEAAIAVFELNVREYPNVVRPNESLGDAYRAAGRLDDARDSYQRASQLAEANASVRLPVLRRKLERLEHEPQQSQLDSQHDNNRR